MNRPKNILLVEDDPNDIELILAALGEKKLADELIVAHDGVEAMEFLRRQGPYAERAPGNPVVVILDLKMPKVNGFQVLRDIKEDANLKTIPVVILSSSQVASDAAECYKLGANAYVVKPVNYQDFANALRHLAVFWGVINEPPPKA